MKLSEKVLDAMGGIDEKLLKESEEYTGKWKTFDLRILVMSAAVLLFAVIIIPKTMMNGNQDAAGNAADAAVDYGEMPQEIDDESKGTAEEETAACTEEEEWEQYIITDELREALQAQDEVKISATVLEGGASVSDEVLENLCEELARSGYEAYTEDGKIIFTVNASEFTPETLPDLYDWVLDLYN